ncbi:helix-turn-helix transcriptional regulator [Kutzneria albida]|uniref:HTH luxR-type domain-containing protein n=1 Tax=Kutzneria albida DSM 43870 TaxID=1449976 RepID=W5WBE5_9PSEU|nr:LuxR C-terminal-related transcriptional regulator [Kutzneria albida]AHH97856.1 hypothetical protein KALB_4494 [Kutzneria albida DSM 43870]
MDLYGRSGEQDRLVSLLPASGAPGRLVLVRGAESIGKTALLHAAAARWRAGGAVLLEVEAGGEYGLDGLLRAVRARFEDLAEPGLVDTVSAIARISAEGGDLYARLRQPLLALFARIAARRPGVLLLDRAADVADPTLVLEAARRGGFLAVATCGDEPEPPSGVLGLVDSADEVITLGPMAPDTVQRLVSRATGRPLDGALMPALSTALGPLAGNPGTVLGTVEDLLGRGRIAQVANHLCLADPQEPIALAREHVLVRRARLAGHAARRLLHVVVALGQVRLRELADLAPVAGTSAEELGAAVDLLVEQGLLLVDAVGHVELVCPALRQALTEELGAGPISAVHADLVLLRDTERTRALRPESLAEHLVHAGDRLDSPAERIEWLIDLARSVAADSPGQAAQWCEAALDHLPTDHARWSGLVVQLLDNAVRAARYDVLARALDRHCPTAAGHPHLRQDLAVAAVLAAVHTGRPPGAAVRAAFEGGTEQENFALAFCDWWFGAREELGAAPASGQSCVAASLPTAAQLELVHLALTGRYADCAARMSRAQQSEVDRLLRAGRLGDLATVFTIALGPRYRLPVSGVLARYRRVLRCYNSGRWSRALSAARELALSQGPPTLVNRRAWLLAAEICSARGDQRQALDWLALTPLDGSTAALRSWVDSGVATRAGDLGLALGTAVDGYRAALAAGVRSDLDALLGRAIGLAVRVDRGEFARELLAEVVRLHQDRELDNGDEVLFLAHAVVDGTMLCARAAASLSRQRGRLPDLARACLVAGRLAEDPTPWLREAYEIAKRLGSSCLRGRVTAVMRARGVTVPRARSPRALFSPTELRIIELIREGWTNHQIAGSIQVAKKTVESYVTKMLARNGFRSRVELVTASLDGRIPVPRR